MTTYNKASLKAFFETNDIPTGTDYANLIDSQINIVETTAQSMAGPLVTTELVTPRVSAAGGSLINMAISNSTIENTSIGITTPATGNFTTVSAVNIYISNFVSAQRIDVNTLNVAGTATFSNTVNLNNTVNVSQGINITNGTFGDALFYTTGSFTGDVSARNYLAPVAIISAVGTAQATASICSAAYCRLQGVTDAAATGFAIPANRAGSTQHIFNETAVSANLWPPTGGKINGLATNAAFGLAANTMYTIMHYTASAYGVK